MSRKAASLIMHHTVTSRAHLTPELALRLITPACPLWTAKGDELPFPDPFWGFYWPGDRLLPDALEATLINASLNEVCVETSAANLIGGRPRCDVLLVGDMFYDAEFAETLFSWLMTLKGTTVLVGDPGRHGLARRRGLRRLASYVLPPHCCLENRGFADTTIWQLDIK